MLNPLVSHCVYLWTSSPLGVGEATVARPESWENTACHFLKKHLFPTHKKTHTHTNPRSPAGPVTMRPKKPEETGTVLTKWTESLRIVNNIHKFRPQCSRNDSFSWHHIHKILIKLKIVQTVPKKQEVYTWDLTSDLDSTLNWTDSGRIFVLVKLNMTSALTQVYSSVFLKWQPQALCLKINNLSAGNRLMLTGWKCLILAVTLR